MGSILLRAGPTSEELRHRGFAAATMSTPVWTCMDDNM
jgi:hypothetical protein